MYDPWDHRPPDTQVCLGISICSIPVVMANCPLDHASRSQLPVDGAKTLRQLMLAGAPRGVSDTHQMRKAAAGATHVGKETVS